MVEYNMRNNEFKEGFTAKSFIKKMIGFSLVTWVGSVISLIAVPLITRLFLPDQVGVINLFATIVTLFSTFAYLGLDQAYVRFFYEPPNDRTKNDLLLFCLLVTGFFVIVVSIAIFLLNDYVSIAISGSTQLWLIICLVVSVTARVDLRFLNLTFRMQQDIRRFTIQGVLMVVVSKVLYLVAAFYNPTYQNAIIIMTAGQAILAFIFMIVQRKEYLTGNFYWDKIMTSEMFKFALPLIPLGILAWLNNSTALLMLRTYVSFEAVGVYSIAVSITNIMALLQAGFNTYWVAFVYENYKTEKEKIKKVHNYITFTMVLFGMLLVLGQDVIFLIVGEKYLYAKTFFPFLLIAPIAYTISETTGLGINISKKTYLSTVSVSISVFANILICMLALPHLGVLGAAIASAVSALIMLMLRTYFGEKYYKSIEGYRPMLIALTLISIMAIMNVIFYNYLLIKYVCFIILILLLILLYKAEYYYLKQFTFNVFNELKKKIG